VANLGLGANVRLGSVAGLLECEVICGGERLDTEVASCFAADLMSDVLAFSTSDTLLITGLTNVQCVHTADVAECRGILFVSGKRPSPEALQLAKERAIPLLSTRHSMFDSCGILFANGIPTARKT
jgi:predicted transcriptional regulator